MSSFLSVVYKAVIRTIVGERRGGGDTFPAVLLLWQNREGRAQKKSPLVSVGSLVIPYDVYYIWHITLS